MAVAVARAQSHSLHRDEPGGGGWFLRAMRRLWPGRMDGRTRTSEGRSPPPRRRTVLTSRPGEYTALGYRAAEVLRKSGNSLPEEGTSADYHTRDDRTLLIAQAREFSRDNGFYKGVKGRSIDNIIGDGFSIQADTGDKAVDAKLEELWRDATLAPETRGLFQWYQLERTAMAELIDAGDFGAIKSTAGLQMVKAERIAGPSDVGVEQGVKLDAAGKPLGFYVSPFDSYGTVDTSRAQYVEAERFIFAANLEEWDQTRGIPAQVANFPMFHRINDITDSEAEAWQILAKFAVAVNVEGAAGESEKTGEEDTAARDGSLADRMQDVGRALFFYGEKGEKISGVERNIPGPKFTESLTMFIRCLGLPLGLPLELILLDWSKTNYSQARAALEQAYRNFKCWQKLLRGAWHSPVYTWFARHWVADGLVPDLPTITKHYWDCPQFPWIDQLKEATAWEKRINTGLATHGEALSSLNRDRREFLERREREVMEAIEIAERINALHPKAMVDWRMFAGVPVSKSQGVNARELGGEEGASDAE